MEFTPDPVQIMGSELPNKDKFFCNFWYLINDIKCFQKGNAIKIPNIFFGIIEVVFQAYWKIQTENSVIIQCLFDHIMKVAGDKLHNIIRMDLAFDKAVSARINIFSCIEGREELLPEFFLIHSKVIKSVQTKLCLLKSFN